MATNRLIISVLIYITSSLGQTSIPQMHHQLLLADEGNGKVHYVNMFNPDENWSATCSNRDMQLIGNDRLMVGDNGGSGYTELNILTGEMIKKVKIAGVNSGINSVFRLSEDNIYSARDGSPAKIHKTDTTGSILSSITLSMDASVRICRPTSKGSYIIGGKIAGMMCEFDSTGDKIWECNAGGEPYMAVRLSNGNTLISNGYGGQIVLADPQGAVVKKFPTSDDKTNDSPFWNAAKPNFFAGFQVLKNSNIVVSNWQGHGAGHGSSGYQLIEIDSTLSKVVSFWKQDASIVSSLHGVLVIDDLDTKILHSDINGILQPLTKPVAIRTPNKNSTPGRLSYFPPEIKTFNLQGRLLTSQTVKHGCFIKMSIKTIDMQKYIGVK